MNLADRDKPLPGMIPFLRSFYELTTLTREALAAWAIGTLFGVGEMLASLRLLHV